MTWGEGRRSEWYLGCFLEVKTRDSLEYCCKTNNWGYNRPWNPWEEKRQKKAFTWQNQTKKAHSLLNPKEAKLRFFFAMVQRVHGRSIKHTELFLSLVLPVSKLLLTVAPPPPPEKKLKPKQDAFCWPSGVSHVFLYRVILIAFRQAAVIQNSQGGSVSCIVQVPIWGLKKNIKIYKYINTGHCLLNLATRIKQICRQPLWLVKR